MATEAGEAGTGSLAQRSAAYLDRQIEALIAKDTDGSPLATGRAAHAMKALWATRALLLADEPADPTPVEAEGDDDDDDFEPPRDDAEGRELDAIILRGLARIRADAAAGVWPAGTARQAGPGAPPEDQTPDGPDTS